MGKLKMRQRVRHKKKRLVRCVISGEFEQCPRRFEWHRTRRIQSFTSSATYLASMVAYAQDRKKSIDCVASDLMADLSSANRRKH
ncbi:hypothetical protein Zmor_000802 [Zophobas morio]|uniref:Uncharacterized protein n=1 Tax=Zophobas morio TaxID=2755281 RepID=A0AA38MR31_9CUCU|nr:hypothetical protein Zmor_000802 [Zophobas morio]